ncbi:uncharacterized protein B0P05DRAFT_554854 [Gilbertella persicaria]|uniref:uncharacterized protein n=1 Tax=Gilbertella persicaria TaxID=101096 RepID=UPI00221E97BE|nr:uncharacterized protein B0P05DRAFT_554854 [Gilbertella persicaria]KAI8064290.1 hypothetical protein B0P05DRAFT_554854 [Gilbertella persicaria]
MSKHGSNLDLPGLSTDKSAHSNVNMTDNDQSMPSATHENIVQSFVDHPFLYNLDQFTPESPFYLIQKSSHSDSNSNHGSTSTLTQSIANTMESFQSAITSSVGEQPPSFWTGLNNFISNVTHNNLFPTIPTIPNIAKSFSEYLANHPVPFLSSFNTTAPASSLSSSSLHFDPMIQLKDVLEHVSTGLQIRVLGVPQTGAKSRVETQIKLCIQLVTDNGNKAQWWSHLKLPEHMVTKERSKKSMATDLPLNPEKTLYLRAKVFCASDPSKKVTTCTPCMQRERKRSQRRKEKSKPENDTPEEDERDGEERILLFNCSDLVDFSAADTILPTRITCYCRHHNEKLGFSIYFEMLDHTGKKVAEGISPPIMITDDHKSNKTKAGLKRRRIEEQEETGSPEPKIPTLDWIKSSLPFNSVKTEEGQFSDTKPAFKSTQFAQEQQFLCSLNNTESTLPSMKRLIPTEAPTSGGIEITILGINFRPGLTVMFGDKPATNIQYWSPTTLICTLPAATQPGAVVVSFKEAPLATNKQNVMVFTYLTESDRALLELALQVVGMKMTGIVEDARKIAMRIVQGNHTESNSLSKLFVKSD